MDRPYGPRDRPHLRRRDRPEVSAVPAVRNPRADEPELIGADDISSPRDMRQLAPETVAGRGRAAEKTLTVDGHLLGSDLHHIASGGDDRLEHRLDAAGARPGSEIASRACGRATKYPGKGVLHDFSRGDADLRHT